MYTIYTIGKIAHVQHQELLRQADRDRMARQARVATETSRHDAGRRLGRPLWLTIARLRSQAQS